MQTTSYQPKLSDLRELSLAVMRPDPAAAMSARTAARCLSGVVRLVAKQYSSDVMHWACGELARVDATLARIPTVGFVPGAEERANALEMIAVVARGIAPIAGAANMRAALSFWACETDPAIWMLLVNG